MRHLLSYSGPPIPKTETGPPEVWTPTDVAFLCHDDSDEGDALARLEPLPAWLVRRRVRVGRNLDGEPLSFLAELSPAQQEDALEAAEDWTQRPTLVLPSDDQWQATQRALDILRDRCPDVYWRKPAGKGEAWGLCLRTGEKLTREGFRLILSRATGQEAPAWLIAGLLDISLAPVGFPVWTLEDWYASRGRKKL